MGMRLVIPNLICKIKGHNWIGILIESEHLEHGLTCRRCGYNTKAKHNQRRLLEEPAK